MTVAGLVIALVVLVALTTMQLLLIVGLPLGEYAWGGRDRVLPPRRRIAAAVAIVIYALFMVILLSRAGLLGPVSVLIVVTTWVLFGYAAFSVLPNMASTSSRERRVQVPVSIALALGVGLVAVSGG